MLATFFTLPILIQQTHGASLDDLDGKWVSVTPGAGLGEPIWFHKAFAGYDANIPWWGQTTIIASDGFKGSHIKVEGLYGGKLGPPGVVSGQNFQCFYYIGIVDSKTMTWARRDGEPGICPESAVFKRDP
jgi:hypothetical protein